jgi:hypothetical protein
MIRAHLLASAALSHAFLLTSDKKLRLVAESLGVAYGDSGTDGVNSLAPFYLAT